MAEGDGGAEDAAAGALQDEGGEGEGCTTTDPYLLCDGAADDSGEEDTAAFYKDVTGAVAAEDEDSDLPFFEDTAGLKDAPPPAPAAASASVGAPGPVARPPPAARPPPRPPHPAQWQVLPQPPPDRLLRSRLLAMRAWAPPAPRPPGFPVLRPRSEHPTEARRFPEPVFTNRPPTLVDGFGAALALEALHSAHAAGAGFEALCGECLEALQKACGEALSGEEFRVAPFDWTPDVRLEPFGSTRQGTALRSSDLDVRLSFVQFEVREEQRQLRYLEGIAASPGPDFEVVRLVRARLPVLRLRYRGQLEVDISLGEDMAGGAEVDTAVRGLLEAAADSGARRFVRLVKMFAKAHGLIDAFGGFLNSVSWVFLALTFLQLEACLPSYGQLQRGAARRALWPARPTLPLLARFFGFVGRCAQSPHHVSIAKGEAKASAHMTWSGNAAAKLFVEHPTKPGQNVAISLTPDGWAKTAALCDSARTRLAAALSEPSGDGASVSDCWSAAIDWVLKGDGDAPAGATAEEGKDDSEGLEAPSKRRRLGDAAAVGGAAVADDQSARGSAPAPRASFRDCAECGTVHRCPAQIPADRKTYCPECRRGGCRGRGRGKR